MKLLKIELEVPEVIMEVEEHIKKFIADKNSRRNRVRSNNVRYALQSDYCFGGGAFSNLYIQQKTTNKITGNVINDVDIFMNFGLFDEDQLRRIPGFENVSMEDHRSGGYAVRAWDTIREVLRFTYKGVKFQIISLYHMSRIWYFDYRFRNFYYKEGQVFASKQALEDIKNKELFAVSFGTPLSTIIRGYKFEYELGFQVNETSKKMLLCCLASNNVEVNRAPELISYLSCDEQGKEFITRKLQRLFYGKTFSETKYGSTNEYINADEVKYPFHEQSKLFFDCYNPVVGEDNYQALENFQFIEHLGKEVVIEDFGYKLFIELFESEKDELESIINDLAFIQLVVEFTSADFEKAKELFKVNNISLSKHKEEMDAVIKAIKEAEKCEQARISVPSTIMESIQVIAEPYWSVKITYDVEDTLSSLYGEKLLVKINPNSKCHSGTYTFRKVQDGNFVLSNTECNDTKYFYRKKVRRKLINELQKACGNIRLGVAGDTAVIRDFSYAGYWFEYKSENEIILNHNQ